MNKFDFQSSDFVAGRKIILNGIVRYNQDFSGWEHEFNNEEFIIDNVLDGGMIKLIAPGFGDLSKDGNYGNGAIFISNDDLLKYTMKEEIK